MYSIGFTLKNITFVFPNRGVEQLVARWAHNPKVAGSSPASATKNSFEKSFTFVISFQLRVMVSYNKLVLLLGFILSVVFSTEAQVNSNTFKNGANVDKFKSKQVSLKEKTLWDKIRVGGDVGFSAGDEVFILKCAPIIFFEFGERFKAGPSLNYVFSRFFRATPKYNTHLFGASAIARYDAIVFPSTNIFFQGEYENLTGTTKDINGQDVKGKWYDSVFLGVGVSQKMGERGSFNIVFSYNLSWTTDHGVYEDPWVIKTYFLF